MCNWWPRHSQMHAKITTTHAEMEFTSCTLKVVFVTKMGARPGFQLGTSRKKCVLVHVVMVLPVILVHLKVIGLKESLDFLCLLNLVWDAETHNLWLNIHCLPFGSTFLQLSQTACGNLGSPSALGKLNEVPLCVCVCLLWETYGAPGSGGHENLLFYVSDRADAHGWVNTGRLFNLSLPHVD